VTRWAYIFDVWAIWLWFWAQFLMLKNGPMVKASFWAIFGQCWAIFLPQNVRSHWQQQLLTTSLHSDWKKMLPP
jgi:hypothetical protein